MNKKSIGVFDSGLGGLSLVHEIRRLLPNENVIYLGDTARVPYGTRSREIIEKFSLEDAKFLVEKDVKCIVIACNTASSVAYEHLKKNVNIPLVDVISPLPDYVDFSSYSKVGIIGTKATIRSNAHKKMIESLNRHIKIFTRACSLFVPLVESGEIEGPTLDIVIKKYLSVFKNENLDSLILGCTHYPLIERSIRKYLGKNVELINPANAAVYKLKSILDENDMLNSESEKARYEYFVTDKVADFEKVAEMFLGEKIEGLVQKVDLG